MVFGKGNCETEFDSQLRSETSVEFDIFGLSVFDKIEQFKLSSSEPAYASQGLLRVSPFELEIGRGNDVNLHSKSFSNIFLHFSRCFCFSLRSLILLSIFCVHFHICNNFKWRLFEAVSI